MGDRFNPKVLEPMEVGGCGLVGKKMTHFGFSKTDAIVQVHGIGPFTTTWVTPMYQLTDKGILLSTSAAEPGRPTGTAPSAASTGNSAPTPAAPVARASSSKPNAPPASSPSTGSKSPTENSSGPSARN